jgi:hypothetical protein
LLVWLLGLALLLALGLKRLGLLLMVGRFED